MYPAQTSLIPAQVALARFWEEGGNLLGDYPYWYLGTTPYRYLTGPILPQVLVFLHRFLPRLSLFEVFFGLIAFCWLVGSLGVYLLVKELGRGGAKKRIALFGAFLYLFGFLAPLLFRFSNGLGLISFSFFPYALLFYWRFLKKFSLGRAIGFGLAVAFLMFLDLAIFPSLFLGLAAVFLARGGWEETEEKLKQSFLVLGASFLISTLWYTPGYWWVSLTGPSLAGQGRLAVIFQLSKLIPTAVALGVAVFSVKLFPKRKLLRDFGFYWLFTFGFLTLIRFLSDFDFWLDWSSYYLELQLGLAIFGGLVLSQSWKKAKAVVFAGAVLVLGFWGWLLNKDVLGTLQEDVRQTVEYRVGEKLAGMVGPEETVFLSGTTAFWLNAFFDIPQVRGGVDQGSVHPTWRRAAWEVREGGDSQESLKPLQDLGVSWLVVHTPESEEYYHDFCHPEKFENADGFKKVGDEKGDRIYKVLD